MAIEKTQYYMFFVFDILEGIPHHFNTVIIKIAKLHVPYSISIFSC
jgi:hypothetical protein